eukprot:718806-Amphidinium_carterae.2
MDEVHHKYACVAEGSPHIAQQQQKDLMHVKQTTGPLCGFGCMCAGPTRLDSMVACCQITAADSSTLAAQGLKFCQRLWRVCTVQVQPRTPAASVECRVPFISRVHVLLIVVQETFKVFIDGGVRRAADIFKAVALGAEACGLGRPVLYSLVASAHELSLHHVGDQCATSWKV